MAKKTKKKKKMKKKKKTKTKLWKTALDKVCTFLLEPPSLEVQYPHLSSMEIRYLKSLYSKASELDHKMSRTRSVKVYEKLDDELEGIKEKIARIESKGYENEEDFDF